VFVFVAVLLAGSAVRAESTYMLVDGGLRVEIDVATDRLAAEFGPRFDRTAVVRSVQLGGVELLGPWGLGDEFGLFGDGVLGYETAAAGETFLKIGVGRLVRDTAESYQFAHPYPVDQLFPVEATPGPNSLSVSQRSAGDGPWQYLYTKSYALDGAIGLTIHYELSNTGARAWTFEHYNHHWFRLQDAPVGPGYEVVTGFELPPAETAFRHTPRSLHMQAPLPPGGAAYYAGDLVDVAAVANTFSLQVDGAIVVSYQAEFRPHRFALYADADGFCPEVFMRAALEPGETVSWSATYRFRTN
jgi:hypothetical protein